MSYAIQCEVSTQVTEDGWRLVKKTLLVEPTTTMKDINEWLGKLKDKPINIQIIEIEIPNPLPS